MKRALIIITLLCASTAFGGGFGPSSLTRDSGIPLTPVLNLTVINQTLDNATITAFYPTEQKNIGNVKPGASCSFSLSGKDLQKTVITAGSTTETVLDTKGIKSVTIIKR